MEQLIKKESQKRIDEQTRQARIQRQKQVRQQAIAWTEATRKKFEDAKERGIKNLALSVTDQVQQAAIENIQLLTKQNDLVLAEIGMAHRAAAGMQQVEKMKALKRLRNQEVAKNRGAEAMAKLLRMKEAESAKKMAILKRKEFVRKVEDNKSKELISRRPPLADQNSDLDKRLQGQDSKQLHPPKYHQSLAKTLRVAASASDTTTKSASGLSLSKTPSETKSFDSKIIEPFLPRFSIRREKNTIVPKTSSLEFLEQRRKETKESQMKKAQEPGGVLPQMVRIHTSIDVNDPASHPQKIIDPGLSLRSQYMGYINPPVKQDNNPSTVRYFDVAVPSGEVKYVAPEGLAVKEVRNSPDAWTKGKISLDVEKVERNLRLQNEEEMKKRADERGKNALKLAKLEKERTAVKNELLQEIDQEILGDGSQKGFLGLADPHSPSRSQKEEDGRNSFSSDEFSEVTSDDQDDPPKTFLSSSLPLSSLPKKSKTMTQYKVAEDDRDNHLVLIPEVDDNKKIPRKKMHSSSSPKNDRTSILSGEGMPTSSTKLSKLEKQPTAAKNELLLETSDDGSQKGSFGLADADAHSPLRSQEEEDGANSFSSDEFSEVTSDEQDFTPKTLSKPMKQYKIPEVDDKSESDSVRGEADRPVSNVSKKPSRKEIKKNGKRADKTPSSTESVGSLSSASKQRSIEKKMQSSSSSKNSRTSISSREGITSSSKSNSTIAEVKILTESMESRGSSLEDLRTRAEEQERLLRDVSKTKPDTPVQVTLKVLRSNKGNDSSTPTTSGSENTSASTDYYHPPEGPYTSTPDGKLQPKQIPRQDNMDDIKKRALNKYVEKFLTRKPASIENLPVSSPNSNSSIIRLDQDLLEASGNLEDSNSLVRNSSSSELISYNSASLTGMLVALSRHQERDLHELSAIKSSVTSPSVPSSSRDQTQTSTDESSLGPNSTLLSSSDGARNSTIYLHRILQRQSRRASMSPSVTGEESSSKSGPDVEAKRLVDELLEEITPVKLLDTPPMKRTPNKNEAEQLSAVFENLISKWSQVKIDPPSPWNVTSK